MKKLTLSSLPILALALFTLSACGGGGGGGGGTTPAPPAQTSPTAAVVKISTTGTLASGALIGGIDMTITLPAGVTVKSTANPPETDAGVVAASGVAAGSMIETNYTAATSGTAGTLRILVANANGFGMGEFATVHCNIASGSTPTAGEFSLPTFTAKDLNGAALSGLAPDFTADIH